MPDTVTLRDRDGRAYGVPAEQAEAYIAQGFRPESDQEGIERTATETFQELHGGVGGALAAGGVGALSGLTLGLSDQALGAFGAGRTLRHLEAEHPYATGAGTVAGALAPAILTGGAATGEEAAGLGARILARSPAGLVGRAGSAISGFGEGAGLAGRVLAGTAGAAAEGALYGGGQYLTESALEDKPLSAESFVAGMGHGALFAAPIGGSGVLASATLQKVRSLFPRAEVSAAAAAGVKGAASSGIAQALRDGDQMAAAAERRLTDVDAGIGVAQAGETSTRRAFGGADPQALGDQVAGAVGRQQITDALGTYRQARSNFEAWVAEGGDPDLERALTGLEPSDLLGRRVPVGEFGPPGGRGIKTPDELERIAAGGAGESLVPALEPQAATAVGKRIATGTPVEPVPASEILRAGPPERARIAVPDGFDVAGGAEAGRVLDEHPAIHAGVPAPSSVSRESFRGNAYVVRPSELEQVGVRGIRSGEDMLTDARTRGVTEAWGRGERVPPLEIDIDPDGTYFVGDGNHRLLAAALDGDRPMLARFRPVESALTNEEPLAADLSRALRSSGASDLEAALRGTKAAVDQGAGIAGIGRRPAAAARAEQKARAGSAAEHFRAQAMAARAERAGLGNPAAPWNEGAIGTGRGGGYEASDMAADERALQARAREEGSASAWEAARAGEVPATPTGLTGMHEALGLNAPRGEAAVSERGTIVDSLMRERMAGVKDEAAIAKAIMRHNGRAGNVGPDIARGAKVIDELESANAKLTDMLAGEAPGTAVQSAAAYRAALQDAQAKSAASSAKAAADLTGKAPAADATAIDDEITTALRKHEARAAAGAPKLLPGAVPAAQATTSAGGYLADVGSALEVLRAVGAHVPAVSAIPVIGPILGLWLKARAVMGILGRKGGAIGKSTEGLIAGTAAAARDRLVAATSALLEGASKVTGKAPKAAGPAMLLAGSLFPGGEEPRDDSPRALFDARSADITRAMSPGAVDQAIGQRYPTSDPALHDAIVAQVQRGIAFLDAKRPKETVLPGMLPGDGSWHPALAAITEFGKYAHAVNDPISVIENLSRGVMSAEGAETLRTVYPELFAYAQRELIKAAPAMAKTLPYTRRIALSIMYQLPVDATMQATHAQFLAAPTPAAPPPTSPSGTSGPLKLGKLTMSPLDQRAAGA